MALVSCTECSKEISDKAAACPNCGAPMMVTAGGAGVQHVRVTRTGGRWEAGGFVLIVIGLLTAMGADGGVAHAGVFTMFIGLAIFIIGRLK